MPDYRWPKGVDPNLHARARNMDTGEILEGPYRALVARVFCWLLAGQKGIIERTGVMD